MVQRFVQRSPVLVSGLAMMVLLMVIVAACSGPESSDDRTPVAETDSAEQGSTVEARTDPTVTVADTTADDIGATSTAAEDVAEIPTTSQTPVVTAEPAATSGVTPTTPAQPAATTTPSAPVDLARVSIGVEQVGSGFTDPVFVTHAGDGSGRVFVLEKVGRVTQLDGTAFLDISDRVLSPPAPSTEQELGLFGLAFHPRFEENGYVYVHYINRNQDHVISRFQAGANGVPDPSAEKVLLTLPQPEVNFAGGMLAFGPDGYLYIGLGTGGQSMNLHEQSPDPASFYGKILRIDVDNGDPYAIPADNPYVDTPGARGEVWAIGLRNPYRFTFDRANGDLYIGSPGQFKREWINYAPGGTAGGKNFGWPVLEGSQCWDLWEGPCDPTGLELPIYEYETYADGNCVVIGGNVYRGQSYQSIQGVYFFGDYCSGRIWGTNRDAAGVWQAAQLGQLPNGPNGALLTSFGEDEAGELYVVSIGEGVIYRITATQ